MNNIHAFSKHLWAKAFVVLRSVSISGFFYNLELVFYYYFYQSEKENVKYSTVNSFKNNFIIAHIIEQTLYYEYYCLL